MRATIGRDLQLLLEFSQAPLSAANLTTWRRRTRRLLSRGRVKGVAVLLGGDQEDLTVSQLQELQRDIIAVIRQIAAVSDLRVGESLSPIALRVNGPLHIAVLPLPRDRTVLLVHGTPTDVFRYNVTRILESGGLERLRRCPSERGPHGHGRPCDQVFVKVGRRQFCSTQCQTRAYMRRYKPGANGK